MKAILTSALTLVTAGAVAQTPYWREQEVFSREGESQRTELIFHSDRGSALSAAFEYSENYVSLNGTWKFRFYNSPDDVPAGLEGIAPENAEGWDDIKVPGNWERQGWGIPIYVNQKYEFAPSRPTPPKLPDGTPAGVYFRTFTVPDGWDGREVYLNICGAKSGAVVYVNGHEAGYGEDSKSLARYKITDYLQPGQNTLMLKITRWSTGSYLECTDFWRISGIERDVYLSSEKAHTGFDFEVVSTLDDEYRDGLFELRIETSGDRTVDFAYELLDKDGTAVLKGDEEAVLGQATFTGEVPDVRKWTAETPELYTLLMEVDGEYTRFNVGFRKFELTDYPQEGFGGVVNDVPGRQWKVFLVNGQPVKFKGVNMHEHDQFTGHYVSRELMLKDLTLMRQANINAIRTCHYPLPRYFYELCDSLGFYVYSEANIESHGMGYDLSRTLGNNPQWYENHLYRVMNMYKRTRNYPCVTILSLGNEAGNGYNFYRCYEQVKEMELKGMNRPVCYERAILEWNTDMFVPQYPGADWFRRMGENGCSKPVCPSEYSHSMGNSTGSLDLQWKYIYEYPNLQGCFIWDWVDQGQAELDADGNFYWAVGGDYGENMPSDGNFCCNGIVSSDRVPHPAMFEVSHVYQDVKVTPESLSEGRFNVFNRFYFRTLEGLTARYTISSDGVPVCTGDIPLSAAPQTSETISVSYPEDLGGAVQHITFDIVDTQGRSLRPAGSVIAWDQYLIKDIVAEPYTASADAGKVKVKKTKETISVTSDKVGFTIDRRSGAVISYKSEGKEIFHDGFGPRPNFWRAPTDNDNGNGFPNRNKVWKDASNAQTTDVKVTNKGTYAVVTANWELPGGWSYSVSYTVHADGAVTVGMSFDGVPSEKPLDVPRIGLRMRMPAAQEGNPFCYFGKGPWENYADRSSGAKTAVYCSSAEAEYVPYARPQECGHHTGCRWLSAGGLKFKADSLFEFNVLRNSIEDLDLGSAHINDVVPRDYIEVCIDLGHSGVGGYDSWGSLPEKSRTVWSNKDYSFGFTMTPDGGQTCPAGQGCRAEKTAHGAAQHGLAPKPYGPVPTKEQLEWQKMETNMFIHFGPNTFTGAEWGDGRENPDVFAPTGLDCRQWVRTAKAAGMKGVIITAKHHDGFCLWPNPVSTHTVAQSAWRDGKGDVLKELSEACKEYGVKFGIYVSPWDRNEPTYGTDAYNQVFCSTLDSALGNYGEVFEQWFDGACGEGPNGKVQVYDWPLYYETVYKHQPQAVIFSNVGPGCRWVGNESGVAGETCWSRINTEGYTPGNGPDPEILGTGQAEGSAWVPAETDVSIRPGWFWRESENDKVKSLSELLDIYFSSVGRNSLLLLNVPPDDRGRIHEADSLRLMEFRNALDEIFKENLAEGAEVSATSVRGGSGLYAPENLLNGNYDSYWCAGGDDGVNFGGNADGTGKTESVTLSLNGVKEFNLIEIQEYIPLGQRIAEFSVDVLDENGDWRRLTQGTTIGYKRLLRTESVKASAVRINIDKAYATPILNGIRLFKSDI